MNPIFKKLAHHLDRIPNGYPATASGVELKILARLFTPEEAEVACNMSLDSLSVNTIAKRLGQNERDTFIKLKSMVKKGLINIERGRDGLLFKLIPFIVGFYERQNARIDAEFARLFEQYYHEALHNMLTIKPSVHRVIPVEQSIPVTMEVMPYERASTYLDQARSWGVLKCICRIQKTLIGQGCGHTIENCLAFSTKTGAFGATDVIREISKEEAFQILASAADEGLVHTTHNTQDGIDYICNCCTCCCGLLRGTIEYENLNSVGTSDFYAEVDQTICSGCSVCVDRCQFRALEVKEGTCRVDKVRCFGCGLCVAACPESALSLRLKNKDDLNPPPKSEKEWQEKRILTRKEKKI
jgi:electron transport complex protein RnfB